MLKRLLGQGKSDISKILRRFRKRDFSGNAGVVLKNSSYHLASNLVVKISSLIFTVIMARLLLPELFGLYSLALSTILVFAAFTELGLGETLVRFVSKELSKKNILKAKSYASHLIKIKIIATGFVLIVLIATARLISENYYQKPIFFALIAGCFYIVFSGINVIFQSILQANNDFKPMFYRDIVVQIAKITLVPLLVLLALRFSMTNEETLFIIISGLAFTYLISSVLLFLSPTCRNFLEDIGKKKISHANKKEVNRFALISSATLLSGIFFGYIDIVMLGYFVSSEFIGYYQAAFSFVSAIIPIISFSASLLPVFSGADKKSLDQLFSRAVFISSLISFAAFLVLAIFSKEIILIVFGSEYLDAVNVLRIFSVMIISIPIITIYSAYFTSIGRPFVVTKALVGSTILNVALNYALISYLVQYGFLYALYGAAVATLASRGVYMTLLIISKKRLNLKTKIEKK